MSDLPQVCSRRLLLLYSSISHTSHTSTSSIAHLIVSLASPHPSITSISLLDLRLAVHGRILHRSSTVSSLHAVHILAVSRPPISVQTPHLLLHQLSGLWLLLELRMLWLLLWLLLMLVTSKVPAEAPVVLLTSTITDLRLSAVTSSSTISSILVIQAVACLLLTSIPAAKHIL